jgi:outer membrane protein assembly factor BamB
MSSPVRSRLILIAVIVSVLLAGCGSTSTASPVPSAGSIASASAPASASSSAGASASASASSSLLASAPAAASVALSPSPSPVPSPSPTPRPTATPRPTPAATPGFTGAAWPMYGGDAVRSGFSSGFPAPTRPAIAWSAGLDGAVYAQPIVSGGRVLVATENDSVYALDPLTGHVLWRAHLGSPVPLSTLPCGNIDPLGITSTPVVDPATGSLFVVAEVTGPRHVLFALDPASGAVRWSRSVDWPGQDPRTHQQRAALALGNGHVYVGFGGLAGDCGQYNGVVVGVPATGSGASIGYVVPTQREGAVWATGGPVIDAAGHLYVSTGNGSSTGGTYDGSDSVVELSPDLTRLGFFAPTTWASDNATDADLGSLSPVLLSGGWVFIAGKSGTGYVLRQGALGGIGGQVSSAPVCAAFGAAAHLGSTAYVPCTDGIRAVSVDSSGAIHVGWHSGAGATGPPAIGGGVAWSVDIGRGALEAVYLSTGALRASIGVGAVPHFAAPSLSGGFVLTGTMRGVVAVRAAP